MLQSNKAQHCRSRAFVSGATKRLRPDVRQPAVSPAAKAGSQLVDKAKLQIQRSLTAAAQRRHPRSEIRERRQARIKRLGLVSGPVQDGALIEDEHASVSLLLER